MQEIFVGHMLVREIHQCRVCSGKNLIEILSLGDQYVTNFLDSPGEEVFKGPLTLVLCDPKNGGCGLLQLKHTFDHDILYKKYWYVSGISKTMIAALSGIADAAERLIKLSKGDIVIDIGTNDGTLLRSYKTSGIIKVGFEPSNLWELAAKDNENIIHDYFNYRSFMERFWDKKAKVITSIAMFYDLDDPNKFVEDVKKCLDENGVWIIQMNYLGLMLGNNTFDNISHEHLEYYSLLSLEYLLDKHDFEVFDVELNDVNGGSFRIYVKNRGSKVNAFDGSKGRLQKLRADERKAGLDKEQAYLTFALNIQKIKKDLLNFLETEKKRGKDILIYGASTRGLVVLQFAGVDKKLIAAAVDKNPEKCGKYIVGTGIPILSIEDYRKMRPDYLFVLPYHFLKEIAVQEREFLEEGGKMVIAIPKLKIIDKNYLKEIERAS
jgi:hypothetical protein